MRVNLNQGILKEENATHDIHYVQGNNTVLFNGNWEVNINSQHLFWDYNEFLIHGLVIRAQHYITIIDAHLLIHPEDVPYLQHKFDELKKGIPLNDYFRLITPAGEMKIIECSITIEHTGEKQFFKGRFNNTGPEAFQSDRLPQEGLSAKAYEYAEQMVQYGNWQINLHTHQTVYSKHVYRIYDTVPGSLKAHPDTFKKFIHPDDSTIVTETLDRALRDRLPFNLEYRIITYNSDLKYVNQISRLAGNETGQEILIGVTIDITEKKLAELAVQEAKEFIQFENEINKHTERITQTGIWQTNLSTRKTQFSDNFYRIYGLRPGALKDSHDTFVNYIYQEDRELVAVSLKAAFEDHVVPQITFRIFRPDGKLKYIALHGKLLVNADQEHIMIGLIQDITDDEVLRKNFKKATHKLAVDLELIMQLEQAGDIGNWQLDLQTNQLVFSENFFRIYGLKPVSGTIGFEHFEKFIHPDDHKFIKEIYAKILTERWSVPIEYKILPPDGYLRHIKAENKIIKTGDGYMVLMGTIRDVTEHIKDLNELQNRIQFIDLLSDSIAEILIVTDAYYNVLSCNRKFEELYQVKREEINDRNIFDIFPALKNPSVIANLNKAITGEPVYIENTTFFSRKMLDINLLPLKEHNGNVIGLVMILRDITEENSLRIQLGKEVNLIQNLINNSNDSIIVLDENLDILMWNNNCERQFTILAKEALNKNMLDLFPSFKQDPAYEYCMNALKGKPEYIKRESGKGIGSNKLQYFIPLQDNSGKTYGVLWILQT